jgi:FdrA protein
MPDVVDVRRGDYRDSVALMRASSRVRGVDGVSDALLAMATELNLGLLADLGFAVPDAGPNDLVVALRAADDDALHAARTAAERLLAEERATPTDPGGGALPPRTLGSALRREPATVALVSVPGQHAFAEALDAVHAGVDVMIFSDNVPVAQEVLLKDEAARRGVFVMGPDCGTAVLGGVGLGFANVVRPGPVGVVAASGTGAQQLMCLLDAAGVGTRAVLGVGGRDLSADVGGRSTLQALRILDEDPATALVVVVSKPPAPDVAARVRAAAGGMSTPVLLALLGRGQEDLSAVAAKAATAVGAPVGGWPQWPVEQAPRAGALRGLFAGGTLCDEAMLLASDALGPVRSNIPLTPDLALRPDLRADGHVFLDFGDDELTRGRPHPIIDPTLRLERLADEARDAGTAVVLLDVVLGWGADPDPAAALAPAIAAAAERLAVVVSLCGTRGDPQGLDRQAEALRDAGASVFLSNAAAARRAISLVQQ